MVWRDVYSQWGEIPLEETALMIVLAPTPQTQSDTEVTSVSLVIPCYNEALGIEQLSERLKLVRSSFSERLNIEVIFVDDGSSDDTASELERRLGQFPWARVVRHSENAGIAAAIMTGIRSASHDLVASMDADCTYDPMQLIALVERMTPEMAIVTASPYHPHGQVVGIPGWRLMLSRGASFSYRCLLNTSIHTYTSCFRLYRRQALLDIDLKDGGFVGVAEMLWQVRRSGGMIAEVPARLTTRRIGVSKMKTIPVIIAHVKLMLRIASDRLFRHRNLYR